MHLGVSTWTVRYRSARALLAEMQRLLVESLPPARLLLFVRRSCCPSGARTRAVVGPLNNYYLLACADDLNAVVEGDDGNNCVATASAIVTVTRPNLAATAVTPAPAVPVRAPGTTFSVTDTVQNLGLAPSGASTTRYYLSLDPVKNAGDTLLTGSRPVPSLAGGASQSGTATVTIPAATPLNSYYLLVCADDLNAVVELDEGHNCVATASAVVTVTRPDLAQEGVSSPPTTKARGTSFAVTDTVHNVGPVPSGASSTRYYLSLDAVKGTGDRKSRPGFVRAVRRGEGRGRCPSTGCMSPTIRQRSARRSAAPAPRRTDERSRR